MSAKPGAWRWRDRWLYAALWAVAYPTLAGAWAFARPEFDVINHGRPMLLAGAAIVLLAAQCLRDRFATGLAALALAINAAWIGSAIAKVPAPGRAPLALQSTRTPLKVITFNMWKYNRNVDEAIAFVRREEPDLILLLEVPRAHRAKIEERLKDILPSAHSCPLPRGCDGLLLSRYPATEASYHQRDAELPPLVYARLQLASGSTIDVIGTHMARPNWVRRQAREIDGLIEFASGWNARGTPLVILGDFNLTPWSSLLARLERRAGVQRHVTLGGSWPALHWYEQPLFMIDHVLSSRGTTSGTVTFGPRLGSDHLPVTVQLRLE